MRVGRVLLIGVLLGGGLGACAPRVREGEFLCHPDQPGSCPDGWACQCRGTACAWRCYQEGGGYCGNGALDPGEECDGDQLGGVTCASLGRGGGTAICRPDCTIYCTQCGDGKPEGDEACDEGDANSDAANASCRTDCRLRRCGDGVIDDRFDEQCDGTVPEGVTCADLGFQGGELGCSSLCQLDLGGCEGRCGDGFKNGAEQCDGTDFGADSCAARGYYSGDLTCLANCQASEAACRGRCGDGEKNGDEACDGADFGGAACGDYGFYTGSLGCSSDCQTIVTGDCAQRCGDGVKNGAEACDGQDLGTESCVTQGFYEGDLACANDCTVDTTGCSLRCGDGAKNGDEACDGQDFGDRTCLSYGYYQGSLSCVYECRHISVAGCSERCGDGIKNGTEQCDGEEFGDDTCQQHGYYAGDLSCLPTCEVSVGGCSGRCGDLIKNGAEECDALDFGGKACTDYPSPGQSNYYGGYLTCADQCATISRAYCSGYCGDGHRNGEERCDGSDLGGVNCQTLSFYGGSLACSPTCGAFVTSGCSGFCGDGVINGPPSGTLEACDGLDQGNATCLDFANTAGGSLACTAGCTRSTATCFVPGWRLYVQSPAPTFENLNAVAATSSSDVWAVGDNGTVLHFDGAAWTNVSIAGGKDLAAVGLRDGKAFVGGEDGVVYAADSKGAWSALNPTEPKPGITALWLPPQGGGGLYLTTLDGVVWRYGAGGWNQELKLEGVALHALAGIGDGSSEPTLVVVGSQGSIWRGVIGSSWAQEASGTTETLRGVWGDDQRMTAVGDGGTLLTCEGGVWSAPTTDMLGSMAAIHGVAGLAFAVGQAGLVARRDTGAWSRVTAAVAADLRGVWLTSESDAWAVGTGGALVRFTGDAWRALPQPTADPVNAIFARARDDVWVVGAAGKTYHFDGTVWTPKGTGETVALTSVWGGGEITYAVGMDGRALVAPDAGGWAVTQQVTSANLRAVAGADQDWVVAAGDGGEVLLTTDLGNNWTPLEKSAEVDLHAAWVPRRDVVVVAGAEGYVAIWDGHWNPLPEPPSRNGTPPELRAVWGTIEADLWVGGSNAGAAYLAHWNGESWRLASLGSLGGADVTALGGRHSADIFAASSAGLLHFDGASWSPMQVGVFARSLSVAPDAVFAAAGSGIVHRLTASLPTPLGAPCTPPIPLYCGTNLEYRGSNVGGQRQIDRYQPASGWDLPGREVCYRLDSAVDGLVSLWLQPATEDLDLVVIEEPVETTQCSAEENANFVSQNGGTELESITVPAKAGLPLFVCVDAPDADVVSAYTLTVDCKR